MKRSAILRKTPLARQTPMRTANRKRKAANSARAYGPKARREWLLARPCLVCGIVGYTQQAHTQNGGKGRKADAKHTIPLCGPHPDANGTLVAGCHAKYEGRRARFDLDMGFTMDHGAAAINAAWQRHQERQGAA